MMKVILRLLFVCASVILVSSDSVIGSELLKEKALSVIPCSTKHYSPFVRKCHTKTCKRVVQDEFASDDEVALLRGIAEKGMGSRSDGGPTIMDLNSGFVRDGAGVINVHRGDTRILFTKAEYEIYKQVVERIRLTLMEEFGLKKLYFTAPTFITRLVGSPTWEASEIHDEYWHEHVDKANTEHYDYSGLLYLSTYEKDFTGGRFAFIDGPEYHYVHPRSGRLIMFTAGEENLHQVQKVESGTRYTLSLWFTCNKKKVFENFLDGKVHQRFGEKVEL